MNNQKLKSLKDNNINNNIIEMNNQLLNLVKEQGIVNMINNMKTEMEDLKECEECNCEYERNFIEKCFSCEQQICCNCVNETHDGHKLCECCYEDIEENCCECCNDIYYDDGYIYECYECEFKACRAQMEDWNDENEDFDLEQMENNCRYYCPECNSNNA